MVVVLASSLPFSFFEVSLCPTVEQSSGQSSKAIPSDLHFESRKLHGMCFRRMHSGVQSPVSDRATRNSASTLCRSFVAISCAESSAGGFQELEHSFGDSSMANKNSITCPRCGSMNMHLSERAEGAINLTAAVAARSRGSVRLRFARAAAKRSLRNYLIVMIYAPMPDRPSAALISSWHASSPIPPIAPSSRTVETLAHRASPIRPS